MVNTFINNEYMDIYDGAMGYMILDWSQVQGYGLMEIQYKSMKEMSFRGSIPCPALYQLSTYFLV